MKRKGRMRSALTTAMRCFLVAAAFLALPRASEAQSIQLLTFTDSSWSYHSNKVDPGYSPADAWTAPGFDDSSWPTGKGLFGLENAGVYPFPFNTRIDNPQSGAGPLSSYFRTHFNWTGPTANVVLSFSNYVDDGMIVFLNGQELFSYNEPDTRPIPWNDLVRPNGANPAGEGNFSTTNIIPANLVVGDNVIAVALHQQANTSSDDVFGMQLHGVLPSAPVDLTPNQPTNRTLLQFRSSILTVSVSGSPAPDFQWYEDGNPVGGNSPSLLITNDSDVEITKNYYCHVSNGLGAFDSRTAAVLYTSDSVPPQVVRASQGGGFNVVIVTFDEVVDLTTATDPFTYHLSDGVNEQDPLNVTLNPDGRSVTVEYENPMQEGTLHTITVGGVQDVAQNPMPGDVNVQFTSWVASDCGGVLFEAFDTADTAGTAISLLTNHPNFPNHPRESYRLRAFTTRSRLVSDDTTPYGDDSHEQYGGRLRALFIPPSSGNWVFYLSSDDAGQLFLNPNGPGESGKILVQNEGGCCNPYSTHPTAPFALEAGHAYYLEAIYKEGGGGDYCHVWAGPEGVPPPAAAAASLTEADAIPGSMLGFPAAPLNAAGTFTITQQPADQSAVPNAVATFSVGTSSDALKCYQWLRNGAEIPNANGSSYTLTVAQGDDGAKFSVRVSILGGNTVTSSEATLTVGQDRTPPTVVSVAANTAGTTLTVTFSEPMGASAANAANYTVNGVAASSATLNAAATVATVVLSAPLSAGGCTLSQVSIAGVTDQATQPNVVSPNPTVVSLSSPYIQVLALGATWKYNDSGADLGTAWQATTFNDSAWLSGPAPLGFEPGTPQVPVVATPIAELTKTNIAYFRTHFNLAVAPSSVVVLQLGEIVDDGAVYYLNGVELHRSYMPAAPAVITATTLATGGGPEPTDGTHTLVTVNVPATALVAGDNVLAVELHPSSLTSSDSEFAAQLNIVQCVPSLAIQHVGSEVKVTWSDAAYRLETAPAPNGPWTIRAGKSGLQLPSAAGNGFFRLVTP